MPVKVTCKCGKRVLLRDGPRTTEPVCPRCRAVLEVPVVEAIQVPPQGPDALAPASQIPDIATVEPLPDLTPKVRRRKSVVRPRPRDLHRLSLGLLLHLLTPIAYLVAVLASGLGCFLSVAAQSKGLDSMATPAHFFLFVAGVCLLLTGVLEITNTALATCTRGGVGRRFLTGALMSYCAGSALAALALFLEDYRPALVTGSLFVVTFAWCLWMGYLAAVGRAIGRPEVSEQAGQTVMSAFRVLALTGGFWFIIAVGVWFAMLLGVRWRAWFPGHLLFLTPASVGAAAKVTWYFGKFESVMEFILFPTGVPFALEYMNFISGTRTIIDREG